MREWHSRLFALEKIRLWCHVEIEKVRRDSINSNFISQFTLMHTTPPYIRLNRSEESFPPIFPFIALVCVPPTQIIECSYFCSHSCYCSRWSMMLFKYWLVRWLEVSTCELTHYISKLLSQQLGERPASSMATSDWQRQYHQWWPQIGALNEK